MNFKNIYQSIFSTFKLFIKSKWKFSAPRSKKILVIDGADDPFKFFFKRKEYEIIYRRGEEINFYVLYKCLKNLGFSRLDYYKNFIEIVKPKIILTYFDHYNFFYKLSKLVKIKTAFVVRGKRTYSDGLFKVKNKNNQTNDKGGNFVDYMFVHNKLIVKKYEKIISGKVIPIGSFLNNIQRKRKTIRKDSILWISTFKPDGKDWINPVNKKKFKNSYFQKNDKYIIKHLYDYSKKNNFKFHILGRLGSKNEIAEIDFYKKIIGENFRFISKRKYPDSYSVIEEFIYVFTTWSTLGVEKLVKGGKVGFIFNKPKNAAWNNARLGAIEGLKKTGPFWTTCKGKDIKEFNRVINFVFKASNLSWQRVRKKIGSKLMFYDYGNKKFKKVIKNTLH